MDKGAFLMVSFAEAIKNFFGSLPIIAMPPSGTPRLPHGGKRSPRYRAHAPDDGRWHMKYHRSRR